MQIARNESTHSTWDQMFFVFLLTILGDLEQRAPRVENGLISVSVLLFGLTLKDGTGGSFSSGKIHVFQICSLSSVPVDVHMLRSERAAGRIIISAFTNVHPL